MADQHDDYAELDPAPALRLPEVLVPLLTVVGQIGVIVGGLFLVTVLK